MLGAQPEPFRGGGGRKEVEDLAPAQLSSPENEERCKRSSYCYENDFHLTDALQGSQGPPG